VVVISRDGRASVAYGATLLRRSLKAAVRDAPRSPGLAFTLFEGRFSSTADLEKAAPKASGEARSIALDQFGRAFDYGVSFEGYLEVPADGFYQVASESDDGSTVAIDDEPVVANDGVHGSQLGSGHIPLSKGLHRLRVKFFQADGGSQLRVLWAISGQPLKPIAPSALFH